MESVRQVPGGFWDAWPRPTPVLIVRGRSRASTVDAIEALSDRKLFPALINEPGELNFTHAGFQMNKQSDKRKPVTRPEIVPPPPRPPKVTSSASADGEGEGKGPVRINMPPKPRAVPTKPPSQRRSNVYVWKGV